jgi:DNA-binding PadR family transcriptional regulator
MKGDRLGEFEELTLLAVRVLGDRTYAVPIRRYVEEATERSVALGAIYAALGRLESKGFVASTMGPATPKRGGKAKRLYSVTPLGFVTAREVHLVRERIWQEITAVPRR